MPTKIQEQQGVLEQKRKELKELFEKYPNMDMDEAVVDDIKARNTELNDLQVKFESLIDLDQIAENNRKSMDEFGRRAGGLPLKTRNVAQDGGHYEKPKSLGEMFIESKAFTEYKSGHGPVDEFDVDVKSLLEQKTVFDTSTGYAPEAIRINKLVNYPLETPMISDLIPQGTTSMNAIKYMEETTFTNAADATAEKEDFPESTLAYTEKSSDVRKIATFMPITEEMIEDIPGIQSVVDDRLGMMIQLKEDTELVSGSGTAPHLRGLLNIVNSQTQAKGSDPTPDAIYKAMILVMTNAFMNPSGVVMHPLDWQDIRLMKTTDGVYIWGNPSEQGADRNWGLPVVKTTSMTQNTALVAAFNTAMQIFRKKGLTIEISNSHSDYFTKGQLAIRADERLALVVYRPAAICKVTGI
jgi:HK97 family phage major capsid protein